MNIKSYFQTSVLKTLSYYYEMMPISDIKLENGFIRMLITVGSCLYIFIILKKFLLLKVFTFKSFMISNFIIKKLKFSAQSSK